MATLTFSIGALARSKTISAGDVTRLTDAMKARFSMPVGATNQEVFDVFTDWLFGIMKAEVLAYEREVAGNSARQNVPDITLT